jgi:hypothetical protein
VPMNATLERPEVSGQGPFEGPLIGPEETGATTEEEFLARVS